MEARQMEKGKMFSVYFINFQYFMQDSFETLEAAVARGKKAGFEFTVYTHTGDNAYHAKDAEVVASWSTFGGTRYYNQEVR
jgi:hypothetical protein